MRRRVVSTESEMIALGGEIAWQLRAGDLILLDGPLGAGKTVFARGIGMGLGVEPPVTSPTFVISRMHQGTLPLIHVDAYRLLAVSEGAGVALDDLDLDSERTNSVTVMEWGKEIGPRLSDEYLLVRIERRDDDQREVNFEVHGQRWEELQI